MHRHFIAVSALLCIACCHPSWAAIETHEQHESALQEAHTLLKKREYKSAYDHFHKMAKGGCPTSQCIVAMMHQHGVGVPKDPKQAIYWYEKSAKQNFADAQLQLGKLYLDGKFIVRQPRLAVFWLKRAADQGVAEAQYLLGKFYIETGGPALAAKGKMLVAKAVRNGWKEALALSESLGQIPDNSQGSGNTLSTGVHNIQESWQGYGDVTKELTDFDKR
jgi:TPR repeat protein